MTIKKLGTKTSLGATVDEKVKKDKINEIIDKINDLSDGTLGDGPYTISDTTQSTSKDTGCLILEGGLGVEKNVNVGGILSTDSIWVINSSSVDIPDGVATDNIDESTAGAGVTIDSVLIKDGGITVSKTAAAASSNSITSNAPAGAIDTESLTTAAGATYILTVNNSFVTATSRVLITCDYTATPGTDGVPVVYVNNAGAGQFLVKIHNAGSTALNGKVVITYVIV